MMNKLIFRIGGSFALAGIAGIIFYAGWKIGYSQGSDRVIGLQRGTLVLGTAVLDDLHSGEIQEATERMERLVFSSAVMLLESNYWRQNNTVQMFVDKVDGYRSTHRKNPEEWTVAETRLEELLAEHRTEQPIGSPRLTDN